MQNEQAEQNLYETAGAEQTERSERSETRSSVNRFAYMSAEAPALRGELRDSRGQHIRLLAGRSAVPASRAFGTSSGQGVRIPYPRWNNMRLPGQRRSFRSLRRSRAAPEPLP